MEINEVLDNAEDSFKEAIKYEVEQDNDIDGDSDEVYDMMCEIADSEVPIYYSDILSVAQSHVGLATEEPEMESKTAIGCITSNIYAMIWEHLDNKKHELVEKAKE